MNDISWASMLIIIHLLGLIFWIGGLFAYLFIVWPTIFAYKPGRFPRDLLGGIAIRTAPWIYVAMGTVLISGIFIAFLDVLPMTISWGTVYSISIISLIANNVYGSVKSWPAMLFAPDSEARKIWTRFFYRMAISFAVGTTMLLSILLNIVSLEICE